jgi:hypothetical protein
MRIKKKVKTLLKNDSKISAELFRFILLLLIVINSGAVSYAQKKPNNRNNAQVLSAALYTMMNINNISTYFYNNGLSDVSPNQDAGFVYPKGTAKTVFYSSGLLWGGTVSGGWSVGGAAYKSGLVPGAIKSDGTPEDQTGEGGRIYRVRSDYKVFTSSEEMVTLYASEMKNEGKTADEIYAAYDKDWKEWPAQKGAPYIDVDADGIYNPDIDIPGMTEEPAQTIWFVANDLNSDAVKNLYGCLPMQVELQSTYWAFKTTGALNNTIFRKYRLINKSANRIDSMYLCMFADPDVGGAFDDFVGIDTNLSLGFAYNASASDEVYQSTPPAAGFDFFQGPRIPGSAFTDSTVFNGRYSKGWKGLGATAFFMFTRNADANWSEPVQGSYASGALKLKNLFQGKLSSDGVLYTDPNTSQKTKFPLSGDPVSGSGWVDGQMHPKNDRVFGIVSGSFTMNPGDTQEIVVGQMAAGAASGVNNKAAVSVLKFNDKAAQNVHDVFSCIPSAPVLTSETQAAPNTITFNWTQSSGLSYRLDVARDMAFTNFVPLYKSRKIASSVYSHSVTDLPENTTLYARIRAYNSGWNHSINSNTVSITVKPVGIEENNSETPKEIVLHQNYPNPFNPATQISYELPKESKVRIEVFNTLGQKIEELVNETKTAGVHQIVFNGKSLPSGVYLYRIIAFPLEGGTAINLTRRMVLVK